ncbi:hypothetical protein A3A49_00990 [Candidatus Curtissbacteria bacterium RIFCSPLOWO2_01_FULL_38_11b]|uniref:SGNH hydrolase-type esterase domain-containing protein n=1 Tax=Candidatus Curtissbacteria bacterium RIFCSPLOWO2_01_FULL_38_11b TaxID=1797725 RepID=A0A1F5GZZ8_9BACT|nr:MAG: hypothetical protein A3A49_00990 [Candidatus Curtissbacteria bacterium RIFCSPLOWO2_01_FULL_38_11b]
MFPRIIKNPKFILFITILCTISLAAYSYLLSDQNILGKKTQESKIVSTSNSNQSQSQPQPAISPSPTPSPKLSKTTYTIALYGDSMIDTMGENLDYLSKSLGALYPKTTFKFYNYGIGSQNIEQGLARWDKEFQYQNRHYDPIDQIKPDVIVLGSFAYNPFPAHDKNRHYIKLKELVSKAKLYTANVYLLAEIAPLNNGFGRGPGGINWPEDLAAKQTNNIVEQLENPITVSKSDNVTLINAYKESLMIGKFGNPVYISSNDGIHPSVEGHVLMANLIAKTIKLK